MSGESAGPISGLMLALKGGLSGADAGLRVSEPASNSPLDSHFPAAGLAIVVAEGDRGVEGEDSKLSSCLDARPSGLRGVVETEVLGEVGAEEVLLEMLSEPLTTCWCPFP